NFILEMKVILSDSNEYTIKPLNKVELDKKMAQEDFEGKLYKNLFNLIEGNREVINNAKPNVSKNSAGYYLWNIWDGETFDLNKLIVGSQGTLGVITEAKIRLVREKSHHDMVALFFKSWDQLPQVTKAILPYEPESLETFDEETLKLGIRFMPEIAKRANMGFFSFLAQFIPEAFIGTRMLGLPKLIILVEVAENDDKEVKRKVKNIIEAIRPFNVWHRVIEKDSEENKFWIMRRESFNLLREHVGNKKTAPFVEDFCILVEKVPEFLPKALKILKDNGIEANIAGHAGNGNFHIIPLMDLREKSERDKILVVSNKFYDLVKEYKGSITAEHNDGIVRTPYLHKMYNPEVLELFRKTKELFDPQNIFNPGKKVNGSFEYLESHIAIE
ncbi:MAG: Oxidoreductase, partial [Parcubacteria group bacterium GW2011_GWC1_39_8]